MRGGGRGATLRALIVFFVLACGRACAECAPYFAGGRCRGRGFFRNGNSRLSPRRTATRKKNLHRSRWPRTAGDRSFPHGRAAASAAGCRAEDLLGHRAPDRPGVFDRARRRHPPNIYLAATSAYGLPIVVPDADGDGVPDRSRRGAPNANFMPGLFGPVVANGGPGSIWKIDGRTGAVTLFANVMLDGVPNSGPALGGLAFDPGSRQLFVADRDTGMIHRFMLDGADRGRFDHGTQALAAAGLPPVPFDPRKRLNIESPAFDSGNPATWAYAPPARRVFGLAVRQRPAFYGVAAGLQIWSVSIAPDGADFGRDPRLELNVPPGGSGRGNLEHRVRRSGRHDVAERGAPTGAYDYWALAVLRREARVALPTEAPRRSAEPRSLASGPGGIRDRRSAELSQ